VINDKFHLKTVLSEFGTYSVASIGMAWQHRLNPTQMDLTKKSRSRGVGRMNGFCYLDKSFKLITMKLCRWAD